MKAPDRFFSSPRTQSLPDIRALAIQRVGVSGPRYPIQLQASNGLLQPGIAILGTTVDYAADAEFAGFGGATAS